MPVFFNAKDKQYYLDTETVISEYGHKTKLIVVNSKREKVCDFISVHSCIVFVNELPLEVARGLEMMKDLQVQLDGRKLIDPKNVLQLELASAPVHTDDDAPALKEAA